MRKQNTKCSCGTGLPSPLPVEASMHTAGGVSGCHHVSEELSTRNLWSPRGTPSSRLEASPNHLSWLTGHAVSTATPTNFCVCIRQGGAYQPREGCGSWGGRYFSHYTSFSQGYMGLTDPYEIHSPTQCPAQPSRKAQHVLHGLIAYQRLVCWQVRERGKRGAASSHYFSTGCLPGASEGTGRLAYICYPLLWLQTDLRTDFFCLFLLFKWAQTCLQ